MEKYSYKQEIYSLEESSDFASCLSYDANGNILSYHRNGKSTAQGVPMDNMTYNYLPGTNKLGHVTDSVVSSPYTEDIETQASGNYRYDRIGNLKYDSVENIQSISWTVYGKIKAINKTNPLSNTATSIQYRYDAAGNRIFKSVNVTSYGTQSYKEDQTFYVRDAQGNVLAVYEKQNEGTTVTPTLAHLGQSGLQTVKVPFRFGAGFADLTTLRWTEQHLYGSSRLGIWKYGQEVPAAAPNANPGQPMEDSLTYGDRYYELSNHLGNVLASISDKKKGFDEGSNNTTDYFMADIASAKDYYPFGMQMVGRKYSSSSSNYRYGFNGKENDSEVKGEGNQQDYGMRIYDPRLGRFLSVDPLIRSFSFYTPYQYAGNTPIQATDLDGAEPDVLTWRIMFYLIKAKLNFSNSESINNQVSDYSRAANNNYGKFDEQRDIGEQVKENQKKTFEAKAKLVGTISKGAVVSSVVVISPFAISAGVAVLPELIAITGISRLNIAESYLVKKK